MKLDQLKEKGRYLALAPFATLSVAPAWAGPLQAAVNEAKTEIGNSQADLVTMMGAMLALGVVIYVGMKIIRLGRG